MENHGNFLSLFFKGEQHSFKLIFLKRIKTNKQKISETTLCLLIQKHPLQLKGYPIALEYDDDRHRPVCQADLGSSTSASIYQLCDLRCLSSISKPLIFPPKQDYQSNISLRRFS